MESVVRTLRALITGQLLRPQCRARGRPRPSAPLMRAPPRARRAGPRDESPNDRLAFGRSQCVGGINYRKRAIQLMVAAATQGAGRSSSGSRAD